MRTLKDMEKQSLIRNAEKAWIICVVGIAVLICIALILACCVGI